MHSLRVYCLRLTGTPQAQRWEGYEKEKAWDVSRIDMFVHVEPLCHEICIVDHICHDHLKLVICSS